MTSALCLHKLYWEEWMPGKTAGHITFLPVSAKLHGLPTVIITTQRRYSTRERVWGISSGGSYVWAVGFIQIPPCILCECACVCVCVCTQLVFVYMIDSLPMRRKEKQLPGGKNSNPTHYWKGSFSFCIPSVAREAENINMCCQMNWFMNFNTLCGY